MFLRVSFTRQGHVLQNYRVQSIRLPGYDGSIGLMAKRHPIIGILKPGLIIAQALDNKEYIYLTTGGFYEMKYNHLTLLLDNLYTEEEGKNMLKEHQTEDKPFFYRDTEELSEPEKLVYALEILKKEIA